jgi:hypothetical protein
VVPLRVSAFDVEGRAILFLSNIEHCVEPDSKCISPRTYSVSSIKLSESSSEVFTLRKDQQYKAREGKKLRTGRIQSLRPAFCRDQMSSRSLHAVLPCGDEVVKMTASADVESDCTKVRSCTTVRFGYPE